MPREIFELTPPQLEWLIDNQTLSLTTAQALDESSKMGWGGFGPMDGYHHHPPHHHRSHLHEMDHGYHYEDMNENFRHAPHDHYHPFDRSPLQDRDPFKNIPSAGMETEDDEPPKSPKKKKGIQDYDPYPHRVGKLTWEQSFENLQVYKGLNKVCCYLFSICVSLINQPQRKHDFSQSIFGSFFFNP